MVASKRAPPASFNERRSDMVPVFARKLWHIDACVHNWWSSGLLTLHVVSCLRVCYAGAER